jgi:hypothetical protein
MMVMITYNIIDTVMVWYGTAGNAGVMAFSMVVLVLVLVLMLQPTRAHSDESLMHTPLAQLAHLPTSLPAYGSRLAFISDRHDDHHIRTSASRRRMMSMANVALMAIRSWL